jgi:hypothetical protein
VEQLSVWAGAGLVTAGVSAALLAGAGAAGAETGTGAESASSSSSDSTGSDAPKPGPKTTPDKPDADKPDTDKPDPDTTEPDTTEPDPADAKKDGVKNNDDHTSKRGTQAGSAPRRKQPVPGTATPEPARVAKQSDPVAKNVVTEVVSAKSEATPSLVKATTVAPTTPAPPSVLGVIQAVVSAVVVNVGSLVFNTVQAIEALVTGPPVLPPASTVTVRSSTILLGNGQRVAANWYYPEGTDVPEHMILLQHGFLALGPMYSYTAANLAAKTQSIVVTPTLSSNPFAGDANWLGGTEMSAAIGDLFEGNREALTQSAIDAGFAARYGLEAVLPRKFALSGHSLGANLVSGAAGHLADDCTVATCAAADLVGVILLDGVPFADTLPNALTALNAKEALTGFIPVREIGAPVNLYNSTSNVNEALTAGRPDRYKGVVLDGGVHSDSMQGGNPLIQFALYVAAGFPQPQNPPAVDELSVQWFNEWFAGDTDEGDDFVAGTTIDIPTPRGTAHGVVIGNAPEVRLLRGPVTIEPTTPSTIPQANPKLATLAA